MCLLVSACADSVEVSVTEPLESIDAADLAKHVEVLASDEFEGRAPSSAGETKTIEYIRGQLQSLGVAPGNGDSFYQAVPLVAIAAAPTAQLLVTGPEFTRSLTYAEDMMVWTKRVTPQVQLVDSELVFVGYGIVAPEYGWDDYAGVDVAGKTVVILVNDPGFASQNEDLFNGNAMTYYGRWTYKYEEAARQGAAGALIVHQTEAAGYPWEVVSGSWSGKQFDLVAADNNMSRLAVEGWLTETAAELVFAAADIDFESAMGRAEMADFQAQNMGLGVSTEITNTLEQSVSNNVLGLIEGTERADEVVIYMAHWDHLGRDASLPGDQIYNGAFDNATGVAALLELAQAHAELGQPLKRSVLFVAVTAEESGLLGSKYYAEHPVFPMHKTLAGINMDGMNVSGRTHDVAVTGFGASDLDAYLVQAAAAQERTVVAEANPEKGYYYRSDHFNMAKYGVPMLYAKSGQQYVGHDRQWGIERAADYVANRYHKPADEYDSSWDFTGMVEDTQMLFEIGRRLADLSDDEVPPNWVEGNEFRAIRDASLQRGQTGS
jgi:Zn-dependent M28 family amino/carboxypeptidase